MTTQKLDPVRAALAPVISQALSGELPEGQSLGMSEDDLGRLLEKPREFKMGDYAFPCFRFAKPMRCKPQEIAEKLGKALAGKTPWLTKVEVVGAFVNLFINQQELAKLILPGMLNNSWYRQPGAPENRKTKVMIEYSQPNTHKEFHVGHVRNVCLGNAMVKMYRHIGYDVLGVNYFGDEGTHIAKCLWYIDKKNLEAPADERGAWLGQQYVAANALLREASEAEQKIYHQEIGTYLAAIESKEGEIYEKWQTTRQWSLDDFDRIYDWLHVTFDELFYESQVSEDSQRIVDEYVKKGVFKEDDGAIGVDLSDYKLGFMIARKRDGNTLYATKDLALAELKFNKFNIDRSIYVVACEQDHHFRQVFKVLELMGFPQADKCYHLSYGMVVLPEGKMSSRSGQSVRFLSMREEILAELHKILAKYDEEWSQEEIDATAHALAEGAIKYGMLSTDPTKEIVYILDDWISFEGNSGPYLMYSYTRTQSILKKAKDAGHAPDATKANGIGGETERELLRYLYDFNDTVVSAAEQYRPSLLMTHLFYMCKAFNRFYAETPVIGAAADDERQVRLAIVEAFSKTLHLGLSLVGITPPKRM